MFWLILSFFICISPLYLGIGIGLWMVVSKKITNASRLQRLVSAIVIIAVWPLIVVASITGAIFEIVGSE